MTVLRFRDFYGNHAAITCNKSNGAALLTIRTDAGRLWFRRTYKTYLGARIALGKLCDCLTAE